MKRPTYSMTQVIVMMMVLMIAVSVTGIGWLSIYQKRDMLHQAAAGSHNTLQTHVSDVDAQFIRLENFMYDMLFSNQDVNTIVFSDDEIAVYQAKQSVISLLDQMIRLMDATECTWVYIPKETSPVFLSRCSHTGIISTDYQRVNQWIIDRLSDQIQKKPLSHARWEVYEDADETYLIWLTQSGGVYCGTWVTLSRLQRLTENAFSFADGAVCQLRLEAEDPKTDGGYEVLQDSVCVFQRSRVAGLMMTVELPQQEILKNVRQSTGYIACVSLIILLVIITTLISQSLLFRPFQTLFASIRSASREQPDAPIAVKSGLQEIVTTTRLINRLTAEITKLKIDIYETQLERKEVQCQYLQIRLQAHFYLNCLSIINAMAQVNKTELIQEMTLCLTQYMRFLYGASEKLIPLEKELEHVRNYARIQELRFPNLFQYHEAVDSSLMDFLIPPIILHTFIENSVEHGMLHDQNNWVRLHACFDMREDMPGVLFTITDSGNGFSQRELERFNAPEHHVTDGKLEGIGIINVLSRIQIIYGQRASIRFSNNDQGGAQIAMWLPMQDEIEGEC